MKILVCGASRTVAKLAGHPNLGQLVTPRTGSLPMPSMMYAADNSAYSSWSEIKFYKMLDRLAGTAPLFVTAPDYVGNARITERLFDKWEPRIRGRGLPVAYEIGRAHV